MSKRKTNYLNIENAQIIFPNFAGAKTKFRPEGNRNFKIVIPEDMIDTLVEDGWNIKFLEPNPNFPDDPSRAIMEVSVTYGEYPPKIMLITGKKRTFLNESNVEILDYSDIENVDLVISPYNWEVNGKSGIKAYVKAMYVTVVVDAFHDKYYGDEVETRDDLDVEEPDFE